ncbi:MAG: hypothetical protein KAH08_05880 [Methylococcales bacterium]|nr:hypothetical protein [Methylococcales bacterium]
MSYDHFKTVQEVAQKFDITLHHKTAFMEEKQITVLDALSLIISENIDDEISFINEMTVCERIISPILNVVSRNHAQLNVWSHVPYNVDEKQGLTGEPDYLIATKTKYGEMASPSLCVIETQKDDFEQAWAYALAEMVASLFLGIRCCYAVVTTGKIWEFGKLEHHIFIRDTASLSMADNLQKNFNYLNWLFNEIAYEAL